MKLIKSIMSAFAIVLATTACAGNSGENKKSNEPTKKENKMEVIALNKADFLMKPIRTIGNLKANVRQLLISMQPGADPVKRCTLFLKNLAKNIVVK